MKASEANKITAAASIELLKNVDKILSDVTASIDAAANRGDTAIRITRDHDFGEAGGSEYCPLKCTILFRVIQDLLNLEGFETRSDRETLVIEWGNRNG